MSDPSSRAPARVCDWCGKAEDHPPTTHMRMLVEQQFDSGAVPVHCCQPVAVHLPKHWTDDNKRQGRDGDVFYDDESDLELGEKASIGFVMALALVCFLALVSWGLPIVAQWWRAVS